MAEGRRYTVPFEAVSVAAQQDFFYIKPAADKVCFIEAVYLAAVGGTADAGDAQEELFDLAMMKLPTTVTVGTGGTAPTPSPIFTGDSAAGFTARVNDTGVATTSGTALLMHIDGMNNRVPYVFIPPPEHRFMIGNAQAMVFRLKTTPADAILMNGTMYVLEIA